MYSLIVAISLISIILLFWRYMQTNRRRKEARNKNKEVMNILLSKLGESSCSVDLAQKISRDIQDIFVPKLLKGTWDVRCFLYLDCDVISQSPAVVQWFLNQSTTKEERNMILKKLDICHRVKYES